MKYLPTLVLLFVFTACNSDDSTLEDVPLENLFITTVELRLEPMNGGDILTSRIYDSNSFPVPGGSDGSSTFGIGQFNTTYLGSLRFLNENVDPPLDLTQEIIDNGTQFQVQFGSIIGGEPYTYEYLAPFDENGEGIGTRFLINSNNDNCGVVSLGLIQNFTQKITSIIGTANEFPGLEGEEIEMIALISNLIECES